MTVGAQALELELREIEKPTVKICFDLNIDGNTLASRHYLAVPYAL